MLKKQPLMAKGTVFDVIAAESKKRRNQILDEMGNVILGQMWEKNITAHYLLFNEDGQSSEVWETGEEAIERDHYDIWSVWPTSDLHLMMQDDYDHTLGQRLNWEEDPDAFDEEITTA